MERSTRIQVYVLCLIVAGSIMTVGYQAYATSCYTRFVFNWFSLNTILQCLDTNSGGITLFSQLHDVFFSNLHNNQVAVYNGSKWVNQNVSTFADTTTCNNLDISNGGYGIVKNYTSGNCNLKSIKPSTGISMTNNSQNILITNTGIISASCSNGVSCSGTNPLSVNGSSLQNQETTVCSSAGGTTYIKSSTGGNCSIKGATAGVGLTLTGNTNDNNYKTNFANGTGVSITGSSSQTFTNTGVISNSCTSPVSCSGNNPSSISCSTCNTDTNSSVYNMLCQNSLGANATSLSCSSFPARKHLVIQIEFTIASTGTNINPSVQFNSDSGNNYAGRQLLNLGGTATTQTSTSKIDLTGSTEGVNDKAEFTLTCLNDATNVKKGCWWMGVGSISVSPTTAPFNAAGSGTWSNTSAQITTVTLTSTNGGTAKYATPNTRITVYGYD